MDAAMFLLKFLEENNFLEGVTTFLQSSEFRIQLIPRVLKLFLSVHSAIKREPSLICTPC